MNCPNCGEQNEPGFRFCVKCGKALPETGVLSGAEEPLPEATGTLPEAGALPEATETEKWSQNMKARAGKTRAFCGRHKVPILVTLGGVLVAIVALVLYSNLVGFEKFGWDDEEYPDGKLTYVVPTTVELGLDLSNEEQLDGIKYEASCGEVVTDGVEVSWKLGEAMGNCKLSASYKARTITKEYTVIAERVAEEDLSLPYEIDEDSEEDLDLDTLTNRQEKEYGTDPELADSDLDGLDDNVELLERKTDPNKTDTDDDGLSDYDEIELGFDPLSADSRGDGQRDGERTLSYAYEDEDVRLMVTGKGDLASTVVDVEVGTQVSDKEGLIDKLYAFHTDGTVEEATVTIPYSDADLAAKGLNEDKLAIYYYNEPEARYEKIDTVVDKVNNTVTAKLEHFSRYVVGATDVVQEKSKTQVLFVLDNSWSMYTDQQYKEITDPDGAGGSVGLGAGNFEGNDATGRRFSLTSELAARFIQKGYEVGLSEFRSDYANAVAIGTDGEKIQSTLSGMNGKFITKTAGTDISGALLEGMEDFADDGDDNFLVILTDGEDSGLASSIGKIIDRANEKRVRVCAVGFGDGAHNTELANVSTGTGCFFSSSDGTEGLVEAFERIGTEVDDDFVDIDEDGQTDGLLVADSGFVVNRDGFSFKNYSSNLVGGHCYGMATFAELYYKKMMPMKADSITVEGLEPSYAFDLSDTYFSSYGDLYDYKLKTNALKYLPYFGFSYFGEESPANVKTVVDETFAFNDEYKKEIENAGLYDIKKKELEDMSSEEKIEKYGADFQDYEYVALNEDKMQDNKKIKNEDKQLFNAIYASFIKQSEMAFYSSSMDAMLWLREHLVHTEDIDYAGEAGFMNILKARLDDRDPLVIGSNFSVGRGLHAINAISLVQDLADPNFYHIGVYDNNFPGEKRYVDMRCKKGKCVTVANEYYTGTNQPVRVSPSMEVDLDFFEQ